MYKGIHKRSGTIVALKIVPIDHDLEELQKEITVMKDCSSNAIVRFYGSFMYKESLWVRHTMFVIVNEWFYLF